MVEMSVPRSRSCGLARFSFARNNAMRILSPSVPIGANDVDANVFGRRNGSPTMEPLPSLQTMAPGSNVCKSSAGILR